MEPAFPLVLTNDDHRLIGEIVEIMGQVDEIVIQMIARLRAVDRAAVIKDVAGSVADKAANMKQAIRNRISDPEILSLADLAGREMKKVADRRNAFIHALFKGDYASGYMEPGYQATSATNFRSQQKRPTTELDVLCVDATRLSCLIAHLDHLLKTPEPSQWLPRIASWLHDNGHPNSPQKGAP